MSDALEWTMGRMSVGPMTVEELAVLLANLRERHRPDLPPLDSKAAISMVHLALLENQVQKLTEIEPPPNALKAWGIPLVVTDSPIVPPGEIWFMSPCSDPNCLQPKPHMRLELKCEGIGTEEEPQPGYVRNLLPGEELCEGGQADG